MTKAEADVLRKLEIKVNDIHVSLLGIPGTTDNGLCGELEIITKEVKSNTTRSKSNSIKIVGLYGITAIIISVILHLMGVY